MSIAPLNPKPTDQHIQLIVRFASPNPARTVGSFKWPTKIRFIQFNEVSHTRPMIDGRDNLKMSHHAFVNDMASTEAISLSSSIFGLLGLSGLFELLELLELFELFILFMLFILSMLFILFMLFRLDRLFDFL